MLISTTISNCVRCANPNAQRHARHAYIISCRSIWFRLIFLIERTKPNFTILGQSTLIAWRTCLDLCVSKGVIKRIFHKWDNNIGTGQVQKIPSIQTLYEIKIIKSSVHPNNISSSRCRILDMQNMYIMKGICQYEFQVNDECRLVSS